MIKIFFTIIIPTYNRATLLIEAINSALNQNYDKYEILICDNCSTDETQEIISNFLQDSKVRYIRHEKNIGFSKNWSTAVCQFAKGDWVLLMCDDDYLIDQDLLSKANELILNHQSVKLIHGNIRYRNEATGLETSTNSQFQTITTGKDYFIRYMNEYRAIISTLALFEREAGIRHHAFSKDIYCLDTSLWTRLMLEGDVAFIPNDIAIYRFHPGNTTFNKYPISRAFDALDDIIEIYELAKTKEYFTSEALECWKINMITQEFFGLVGNNVERSEAQAFTKLAIKKFPFLTNMIYQHALYYLKQLETDC